MVKKSIVLYFSLILGMPCLSSQFTINLSGEWDVQLDTLNAMIESLPAICNVSGIINLPSSLAESKYGFKTEGSDFGVLTPEYKYVGKAWYSREIEIPPSWKNKHIEIFLERVLWESRVLIDGVEISRRDALGSPHLHEVGKITPGKHRLTIVVNNEMIHNIGDKGHAYGEYTQSIWNGIIGRMEIRAHDQTRIESVQIYPNLAKDNIKMKLQIYDDNGIAGIVQYEIRSVNSGQTVLEGVKEIQLSEGENIISFDIPAKNKLKLWSEFTPEVYNLKTILRTDSSLSIKSEEFGFYEVSHDGTKILINGDPVFLRGNLDCVHFPLTGYPSCKVEDWERIFRIYKDYGLNHARFHSWCPPEAAFKAANRVGIYLQAEASIWIDWWMSEDMNLRGRPEMDTKGHPKGLGHDPKRDQFVIKEMNRMVDAYGNHPSFTMFCIGNELGNSDFEEMAKWVADLKDKDPRRLYSVSTARKITQTDEFNATHFIQGVGRTRGLNGAGTNWDFEEVYGQMDIPIIAHEIGQWPVYPRWSEINKYTGVLKARNLEKLNSQAEKNGIVDQDEDFARASGALNQIMYKYEIESFLRTKSCAGIQLLSMQDYQGQGEALIGWLDAHWESKGITSPKIFKHHHNTTVPLLRMDKYVWTSDEDFNAKILVSHHGAKNIYGEVTWTVANEWGKTLWKGSFDNNEFSVGSLTEVGDFQLEFESIETATKLKITVRIDGTEFVNEWDIWVYPGLANESISDGILITDEIDKIAKEVLKTGGKVLLIANELGMPENTVSAHFYPLYWSLTFFPGQGKTNIGLLVNEDHPAFQDFPTSYHSDWQWETISDDAKGFILNELPSNYKPIAQPVDDFHRNNKVGSIFELKVGMGNLLVCGYNLNSNKVVGNQLKYSIIKYMTSSNFAPDQEVGLEWVEKKFRALPKAENVAVPEKFENALLYINAAANATEVNKNIPWESDLDEVVISKDASYNLESGGVWKDDNGSAWHGEKINLKVNCPSGIQGALYVHFQDWNNKGRTGILEFEGRKVKLESHEGEGQWVKFYIMREDSNDGKIILDASVLKGGNLMISNVVLMVE